MTDPKGTRRRRRAAGADGLPRDLVAWFSGEVEPEPEYPPLVLTEERLAFLRTMPERALNESERRALGLIVGPPMPRPPWSALLWPDFALLPERWRAWKAEHPKATPPAGYTWLDDPASPQHPPAWLLEQAHACANRGRRR